MPWTFAHPAAVLPLRRYCPATLNFPALILGSMAPDLGYHFLRKDLALHAHTLKGSFVMCLPAALFLLGVLCLVRKPLCYLLPQPHRDAFAPMAAAPLSVGPRALLAAAASIVLGAWTHILWDSFTHDDGWFVLRVTLLQHPLFNVAGLHLYVYNALQDLCTCLGVAVLAAAYWHWLSRQRSGTAARSPGDDAWRHAVLAGLAVTAACIALTIATVVAARYHGGYAVRVFVFRGAVDGMSAFIALYLLTAVICYRARRGT